MKRTIVNKVDLSGKRSKKYNCQYSISCIMQQNIFIANTIQEAIIYFISCIIQENLNPFDGLYKIKRYNYTKNDYKLINKYEGNYNNIIKLLELKEEGKRFKYYKEYYQENKEKLLKNQKIIREKRKLLKQGTK